MNNTEILKEFDAEVKELRSDRRIIDYGETVTHRFGHRYLATEKGQTIYATATDWGNIRNFIQQALEQKDREKIEALTEMKLVISENLFFSSGLLGCTVSLEDLREYINSLSEQKGKYND